MSVHAIDSATSTTIRVALDRFLSSPRCKNTNTRHAYTNVLDRVANKLGADHQLVGVSGDRLAEVLDELLGTSMQATWNRNRAAVASFVTWCAKNPIFAPALPASAERRREDIPRMRSHPGEKHIVNTSSAATFAGVPGHAACAASKMVVNGPPLGAREECKRINIGVSVLYPGLVTTPIVTSERLRPRNEQSQERGVIPWTSYVEEVQGNQARATPRTSVALEPEDVGPMVIQAIKDNESLILTTSSAERIRAAAEQIAHTGASRMPLRR